MTEKISGYRSKSDDEINSINQVKELEGILTEMLNELQDSENGRYVAIARTHFETGFMYAVKAIAKPTSIGS